ncbi:exodeoxyribonuclease V subunit gamma [Leptospira alstonii]|uniref:Exodeoxyribonuclease V, gamma subunit domain protein n=2 Tax=Leptospira alstonii TaxID=28452 RepID=M6DCT3_9LEPT|nr:exodeoxyribonuclease V subunit gamma [Leptospira alstonii]EMJ96375.1 exodeoxyribonuclease V, gamma subunit domain protein [Leptospira alstonii serovar Sichuan str. 79601]EQA81730.1 exodeoxyribonuclease V, gamma subunit domain protein [Leptospira alstonii serovar Pingchang str. 80-412]
MSITHITSLSLDDIAAELSRNILEERKKFPLHAPVIVVPSANMKLWLNLNLSKISGLSANLRFLYLEKALEEYFHLRADLDYDPFRRAFPSQEATQRKILTFLIENANAEETKFLRSYLGSISRAFSLSAKLAGLYKDYELNRSSWIWSWAKEKGIDVPMISHRPTPFPKEDEYYRFQKELYQKVFLNSKEPNTLVQFFLKETRKNKKQSPRNFPSLHLFCLSNLADTYLGILESLSEKDRLPIYLYQFYTGVVPKTNNAEGPQRWSNPQIHIASRTASISGTVFKNTESSRTYPKKLAVLRNILKGDESAPNADELAQDVSVRFWNAPSVYRETESVANDILYKMNQDHKSTYLDFAILVTDMKVYRPAVEWVFDGGILLQTQADASPVRKKIPYSLTDIKANEASLLYRGLMNFWEICSRNSIDKNGLLKLLRNPLLRRKVRIHSVSDLEKLIETSGVRYEETGREKDIFQISNGLKRIRLSSILSAETAWTKYKIARVPLESDASSSDLTDFWEAVLKAKNEILSFFEGKTIRWTSDYLETVRTSLEELFEFSDEYEQEGKLFQDWLESLFEWEGISLQNKEEGIALLKFITEQTFDRIPYRKGAYLTGGVTISLLQPMRPIPFKHIYILGLGEGKFPGSNDRSRLNLRNDFREEWDISRREIQESLLWETVHSAQESLTLSYVGKNLQEDKTFEPCSHLFEIMESLRVEEAVKLPLHSYSMKYEHTPEELKQGLVSYDFARVWVNGNRKDHTILRRFQNPDELAKVSSAPPQSGIDVKELSRFLSDPLDAYLKRKLGMYLEEEEIRENEREPFELDAIAETSILKKVHALMIPDLVSKETWSWGREKISETLSPILEMEKSSAKFPMSVFGRIQEADLVQYLVTTSEHLREWKPLFQGGTYYPYLSLGDTGLPDFICKKMPELKIPLESGRFSIKGEWEHVIEKDGNLYWLFSKSLEEKPEEDYFGYKDYWKVMSFPFLTGVAFASANENFKIYSFKPRPSEESKKKNTFPLEYQIESASVGIEYLAKILMDYLKEDPVFFPRRAFLNYYVKHIQGGGKTQEPDDVSKFEDETAWIRFLKEELSGVKEGLPSLVKLYPKTPDLILQSRIEWARNFYKPLLDWKKDL